MLRELAQIVMAIHMSVSPFKHISETKVQQYSVEIQKNAESIQVDPFLYVAIIAHESVFDEHTISPDGQDYGLMQIRARYYNGGKHSEWLFNPHTNLMAGSFVIQKSIDFCQNYLKREPSLQEWLSVYQGSRPSCKPTKLTKIVEDYYLCLVKNIEENSVDRPLTDCRKIYYGSY